MTDEDGHTQIFKSYSLLQDRFFEHMRAAGFNDFDRGERGSTAEHLSVIEYKTKKESERLAEAEAKQTEVLMEIEDLTEKMKEASEKANAATRRMNKLAPKLKNIEEYARKYSDDADSVLPDIGALESAKSYRDKKAKPLFKMLTKVLRGLYHAYLDLKQNLERLKEKYNRLQQNYASLDRSFNRIRTENKKLKSASDAYDTLCRGYGEEEIEAKVKALADKEAMEQNLHRTALHRYEINAR